MRMVECVGVVGASVLRERLREGGISSGGGGGGGGVGAGGSGGVGVAPGSTSGQEAGRPLSSLSARQADAFAASWSSEKGTELR